MEIIKCWTENNGFTTKNYSFQTTPSFQTPLVDFQHQLILINAKPSADRKALIHFSLFAKSGRGLVERDAYLQFEEALSIRVFRVFPWKCTRVHCTATHNPLSKAAIQLCALSQGATVACLDTDRKLVASATRPPLHRHRHLLAEI